jgi:hypothetical protein
MKCQVDNISEHLHEPLKQLFPILSISAMVAYGHRDLKPRASLLKKGKTRGL